MFRLRLVLLGLFLGVGAVPPPPEGFIPLGTHLFMLDIASLFLKPINGFYQVSVFLYYRDWFFGLSTGSILLITVVLQIVTWKGNPAGGVEPGHWPLEESRICAQHGYSSRVLRQAKEWEDNIKAPYFGILALFGFASQSNLSMFTCLSALASLFFDARSIADGHTVAYMTPEFGDVEEKGPNGKPHPPGMTMYLGSAAVRIATYPNHAWFIYAPMAMGCELALLTVALVTVGPLITVWFYVASALAAAAASGQASYFLGVLLFPAGMFLAPDASPFGLNSRPVPAAMPLAAIALRMVLLPSLMLAIASHVLWEDFFHPLTKIHNMWTRLPFEFWAYFAPLYTTLEDVSDGTLLYRSVLILTVCLLVPVHLCVTLFLFSGKEYRTGVRDEELLKLSARRHREIGKWSRKRQEELKDVPLGKMIQRGLVAERPFLAGLGLDSYPAYDDPVPSPPPTPSSREPGDDSKSSGRSARLGGAVGAATPLRTDDAENAKYGGV